MAQDPRKYIISTCDRGRQASISNTTARKDFYTKKNLGIASAAGKIGDFELLNDVPGVNKVAAGLRVMSELSDTVRDTGIPLRIGDPVEFVGDKIGVSAGAVQAVNAFNPGVANRYTNQANAVMDKVTAGNFTFEDIPSAFQDLNNLATLAAGIFSGPAGADPVDAPTCYASPYAEDLAYEFAPKQPFLFIVEFIFNEFQITDIEFPKAMANLVKTSSRPNVRFEYEEVNMYNFRTKVIKRSEFEQMTMSFHDDQQEKSLYTIYNNYLQRIAPITRMHPDSSVLYEENGMNFNDTANTSASIGSLPTAANAAVKPKTIMKEIRLHHISNYGKNASTFHFMNPKIEEMQLSDLDMATSEPSQVQIQFSYDGLFVQPWTPLPSTDLNITDLTSLGKWPIIPLAGEGARTGPAEEDYSVLGVLDGGAGSILDDATARIPTPTIPTADELTNLVGGTDFDF